MYLVLRNFPSGYYRGSHFLTIYYLLEMPRIGHFVEFYFVVYFPRPMEGIGNCIHLILPLRRPGPPVFLGVQSRTKTNTKTLLHTHSIPHTHYFTSPTILILPILTLHSPLTHTCPISSAPSAKHIHIP